MKINEDNLQPLVLKGSTLTLVFAAAVSGMFFQKPVTLGVIAGGLIAIANFIWQSSAASRLLSGQTDKPAASSAIRFILRLTIIALLLYLIIVSGYFSIAGLLLGLSVVVITIFCITICLAIKNKGD